MKLDDAGISEELKTAIIYDDNDQGVVGRIAKRINKTPRTVYAFLDGDIRMTLEFLHAAVIETSGHPVIKRFLEPEGWELIQRVGGNEGQPEDPEKEVGDIYLKLSATHASIREAMKDGKIDPSEKKSIEKTLVGLKKEIADVESLLK